MPSLYRVIGMLGVDDYDYEVLSELAPPYGFNVYKKMRMNDPLIGGIVFQIETVLRRVKYRWRGKVTKYLEGLNIEKLVWDFTSAVVYGFYCGEKIWKLDNFVRLVDIEPRHPVSIDSVEKDVVIQEGKKIPKSKVVWVVIQSDCRNTFGISLLRNVYKPYYYKTRVEASEANGVDRDLSGLPVLTAPENFNFAEAENDPVVNETLKWAIDVVSNIRADSMKGVVKPYGWELELLRASGTSSKSDTTGMIKRYNTEICMGLLETFITSGLGSNLNGAEAGLHLETFLTACDSIAKVFAKAINEQVLPQACEYNGDVCECWVEPLPQTNYNLKDLASYVARLVNQEVIEPTPALEDSLLKIANLPGKDDV